MSNMPSDPNNEEDQEATVLGSMQSSTSAYLDYMANLKAGAASGITDNFGTVSLGNASARLNAISQKLMAISQSSSDSGAQAQTFEKHFSVEDKVGAVYAILSGALDVKAVSDSYGAKPENVAHWLEVACRAIEEALRIDAAAPNYYPAHPETEKKFVAAESKQEAKVTKDAPAHLNIMSIAADFQKYYINSLKAGKHSGISDKFGKASALLVPPIPAPTPIREGLEPENEVDFQAKAQILQESMRKFCQNFLSNYLEDGRNGKNGKTLSRALSKSSKDESTHELVVLKELVCASLFISVLDQGNVDELPKWLQSFLGHSFIRSDEIIDTPKAEQIAYTYAEMEDYEICKLIAERATRALGVGNYCDSAVLPIYQFLYQSGAERRELIENALSAP